MLFTKNGIFEIVDENKIHSLDFTLNILAKHIAAFLPTDPLTQEFHYRFCLGDNPEEIILTTNGVIRWSETMETNSEFVMSAKICNLNGYCMISHSILKICWTHWTWWIWWVLNNFNFHHLRWSEINEYC